MRINDLTATASTVLSDAGGALLAGATGVIAAVRPADKPLHPRGETWTGRLFRHGSTRPCGVPWIDERGEDEALVRYSAAIGLPRGWPDFSGIGMRIEGPQGPADLLMASTGSGSLARFLLRPALGPDGFHSCLLPYEGPTGPVFLGAWPLGGGNLELLHSVEGEPWTPFAELIVAERSVEEPSFAPIQYPLPGLANYDWVERLRAPAYRTARRSRGTSPVHPDQDGPGPG
jgi:hypothetical protein